MNATARSNTKYMEIPASATARENGPPNSSAVNSLSPDKGGDMSIIVNENA